MKIFTAIGPPTKSSWEGGVQLMQRRGITTLPKTTLGLPAVIESFKGKLKLEPQALDLVSKCLIMNPLKRCTAHSARKHPFCTFTKQLSISLGKQEAVEEPLLCTTVKPSPPHASASASSASESPLLESTLDIDEMLKMLGEVEKSHDHIPSEKISEKSKSK